MAFASVAFTIVGVFLIWPVLTADSPCPDGRSCPETWSCCEYGCCAPSTLPIGKRDHTVAKNYYTDDFAYFGTWPLICLLTILGILATCVWCLCRNGSRQCACMFACCVRRGASEHDSAGSCYPPPQYSRCGSFHQAPPPYSEVTSKPDLYPLVITCGEGENKGGNYLMVHYFRNYVFRAPGSLSATSTAESLNSSYICNATNEANSNIPPPYSHTDNYEEWPRVAPILRSLSTLSDPRGPQAPPRSRTAPPDPPSVMLCLNDESPDDGYRDNITNSPIQPRDTTCELGLDLIDYDLGCDSGCRPKLGHSPPIRISPSQGEEAISKFDYKKLRHLYSCSTDNTCESPPEPTSPTETSGELTLSAEQRYIRREIAKKTSYLRKSSLYMPLSSNYIGNVSRIALGYRASFHSAPESPPEPTSPTQTPRESPLTEEQRFIRQEIAKKTSILRKSSLYMPLSSNYNGKVSRISPGSRASFRSAPESPPEPTSPTQTPRESPLSEEQRYIRQKIAKKTSILRKSSLYMPLSSNYNGKVSRISPGSRASSRSAPATPVGSLVPNMYSFTQKLSASRESSNSLNLEEENDSLLTDSEAAKDGDHKL